MNCFKCSDTGFIVAEDRAKHSLFTFRCGSCGTANLRNLAQIIPIFLERHLAQFKPDCEGRTGATFNRSPITRQGSFVANAAKEGA